MRTITARIFLAAGLAVSAATGHAATLGLATDAPAVTGTGDVFYVRGTDLSFIGLSNAGLDISAAAAFATEGGLDPAVLPGVLLVDGALSAMITEVGYQIDPGTDGGDIIELLLNVEGGNLASIFGGSALALLTGEFGTDEGFAAAEFFSSAQIEVSALTDVAPIPLPAGGILLLSGVALIALRRTPVSRVQTRGPHSEDLDAFIVSTPLPAKEA